MLHLSLWNHRYQHTQTLRSVPHSHTAHCFSFSFILPHQRLPKGCFARINRLPNFGIHSACEHRSNIFADSLSPRKIPSVSLGLSTSYLQILYFSSWAPFLCPLITKYDSNFSQSFIYLFHSSRLFRIRCELYNSLVWWSWNNKKTLKIFVIFSCFRYGVLFDGIFNHNRFKTIFNNPLISHSSVSKASTSKRDLCFECSKIGVFYHIHQRHLCFFLHNQRYFEYSSGLHNDTIVQCTYLSHSYHFSRIEQ